MPAIIVRAYHEALVVHEAAGGVPVGPAHRGQRRPDAALRLPDLRGLEPSLDDAEGVVAATRDHHAAVRQLPDREAVAPAGELASVLPRVEGPRLTLDKHAALQGASAAPSV